ncbi:MAG: TM0106 family RecB-like putative nuclease [Proteobacteria bacterium]|nr:TM0106 family RecB-like putative nuclease [Pseudomonadota bacterium]
MHIGKPRPQDCPREKISASLFEAGLKCMTKCFLRLQGETGSGNPYADWLMTQAESYRKIGIRCFTGGNIYDDYTIDCTGMDNLKVSKWQLAVNLAVSTKNLESRLHAVERVHSEGRGKPTQFIPIRFIFSNRITKDDKLLMAFDALVLSKMLGCKISLSRIIHGDSHTTLKVRTSSLAKEVQKVTQKIETMISSHSTPDLFLNRHCVECEFQARCRLKAIEKDELSLLSGMTDQERKKFNSTGIFTITQLSYSFRPRRRTKRRPEKREKYHHSLKALSIREKKIHIVGRPELKVEGKQVFMDVEGLPDRDSYYLIGIRLKTDAGMIQHSLWADRLDEEEKIWADFLKILSAIDNPTLIHYGRYETTFIKRMCSRYGNPPEGSRIAKAIGSMVNLVSVIFAQIYFPTFSNGLKEIAEHLGFSWSAPTVSGVQTIAWRHEWETSKEPTLKGALLSYNAQDCEALQLVTDKIVNLCQTFLESGSSSLKDAVHTERLKRDHPYGFKRNSFCLPELDAINKAAYWDYQRERVYVKSNARLRGVLSCFPDVRKLLSPNKTIEWPRPRSCPRCDSVRFFGHVKKTKTVADLKFMKHGIKRWIICYRFHRYKCQRCGATFLPEERSWTRSKLGPGIVAYSLYQNIGLRLSQESVDRSINRLFGFNLAIGTTGCIKAKAANIYMETYDRIIKRLCKGQLLHADETKISVGGMDGFVWVLANMEEVAYIYNETRQGDTLHSLLKDFTGVLVSDFYAAYDGIQCPQQKCLIHLIRDLNDAVLKYPFDGELKSLVKGFADLVRPMVETVDRHGLKSHFLRKHLVAVGRFYRRISGTAFQSESAIKFKERFEKNKDKLFTFLKYDGVPWNNNNAEHAIKAFAMLRHLIKGVTSEKGLRDYLVMLSICETCKYKKADFLDFLLSGEKDIGAFVKSKSREQVSPPGGIIPRDV